MMTGGRRQCQCFPRANLELSILVQNKELFMKKFAAVLSLLVALGMAVPTALADETKPVRVLFVLGSPPFHDIRTLPPILERALDQVGGFQVTRLEPPKDKP